MSDKKKAYLLDETIATSGMLWWLLGIMCVSAIAGGISGAQEFNWIVIVVIVACIGLIVLSVLLSYFLICRRMRLRMDESCVWTHIPLTKDRLLTWTSIRTAAVVTLRNMNYPAMIVLSIHAPEEALTRKRMMWKNPVRGEELRFPVNDSRRAIVEQQLGMKLPDIQL